MLQGEHAKAQNIRSVALFLTKFEALAGNDGRVGSCFVWELEIVLRTSERVDYQRLRIRTVWYLWVHCYASKLMYKAMHALLGCTGCYRGGRSIFSILTCICGAVITRTCQHPWHTTTTLRRLPTLKRGKQGVGGAGRVSYYGQGPRNKRLPRPQMSEILVLRWCCLSYYTY